MRKSLRRALTVLILLIFGVSKAWANSPPVVSNVTAAQRPDKIVEIRYDLTDIDTDPCTVTVQASHDAGATWTVSATALTGAVGTGVTPGAGKLILWDSKVDLPGVVGSQFRVRICAADDQDRPPVITGAVIAGTLNQSQQGTVQFSCTATASGTVQAVTVDLTAIGGSNAQPLARGTGDQWQGSALVLSPGTGVKTVTFTAVTSGGLSAAVGASIEVAPPGMMRVPAGEFQMGDPFTVEGDAIERPRHGVFVDKFFMDRYEVTNQQYASGLNWALGQGNLITVTSGVVYQHGSGTSYPYCNTAAGTSVSRITWSGTSFGSVPGNENHPVTEVSWYGAVAYANWRSAMQGRPACYDLSTWTCNWGSGYRLPTEAEWEKAARGGATGRRFPWADVDTIDFSRANYYSSASPFYDTVAIAGYHPSFMGVYPYTAPVGYFAANGYGLYDMAGNVWEWCNDWYDPGYYAVSPYTNPRGPASGANRMLRGGSWASVALNQRCAYRSSGVPTFRGMLNGLRLALSSD